MGGPAYHEPARGEKRCRQWGSRLDIGGKRGARTGVPIMCAWSLRRLRMVQDRHHILISGIMPSSVLHT